MRVARTVLVLMVRGCNEVDGEMLYLVAARVEHDLPLVLSALEHRRVQLLLLVELRHALDRPAVLALQNGVGVGGGELRLGGGGLRRGGRGRGGRGRGGGCGRSGGGL